MNKFKIGDRVRCNTTRYDDDESYKGKKYVIKNIKYDGYYFEDGDWFMMLFNLDNLFELVNEYTWTSKFNIGDRVVISWSTFKYHTINEIRIDDIGYNVYCFDEDLCIVNENELSLYEELKTKELTVQEISDLLGYDVKVVK